MAFNPYYQNSYQPMGYNGQYGNYALKTPQEPRKRLCAKLQG